MGRFRVHVFAGEESVRVVWKWKAGKGGECGVRCDTIFEGGGERRSPRLSRVLVGPLRLIPFSLHRNETREFIITFQSWHVAPLIPSVLHGSGYEDVAITDLTSSDQPVGSGLLVLMRRRVVLIGKVTMYKISRITCFQEVNI